MKIKKKLRRGFARKNITGRKGDFLTEIAMFTICAVAAIAISFGVRIFDVTDDSQVYAASEEQTTEWTENVVVSRQEVTDSPEEEVKTQRKVNRIGMSCEDVVVGQRVSTIHNDYSAMNVSEEMANAVNIMDQAAVMLASTPDIMSDEDYETLLKIVEAEAGTEDLKGRILVANVIMNRVKHEEFPDNITDVVYEYRAGVPQFSPVYDGRIYRVTVSDQTREAVKQAIEGADYSEGALFFVYKSAAEKDNVEWFEKELKSLFKHGVHEFYTYPDEVEMIATKETKDTDDEVIQMAKGDILE